MKSEAQRCGMYYINSRWLGGTLTNFGTIKKRIALTGTGKIKRKHAFKSHILTKKTLKQKRNLTHTGVVATVDQNNVKSLLGLR